MRNTSAFLVAGASLAILLGLLMPLARDRWGHAYNGFTGPRVYSLQLNKVTGIYGLAMVLVAGSLLVCSLGVLLPTLSGSGKWAFWYALGGVLITLLLCMLMKSCEGFARLDIGFFVVVVGEAIALMGGALCRFYSRKLERLEELRAVSNRIKATGGDGRRGNRAR